MSVCDVDRVYVLDRRVFRASASRIRNTYQILVVIRIYYIIICRTLFVRTRARAYLSTIVQSKKKPLLILVTSREHAERLGVFSLS